jgi:peroxiredoxin
MPASAPVRPPVAGERAPDFTLPSTSGESVTLRDFRGERAVLLAFFPLAFTSTCTAELCAFSEDFDQFEGSGVAILPISVDSIPTLKEFKAKHNMHADLLSDFKREVSRAYGVLNEERFVSGRAYFLIDREGVVRWAHVEENPSHRRENGEILARIAELSEVTEAR